MNIKSLTKILLGITVVTLIGYDVFAVIKGGTEATISNVIIQWSYQFPAMTFGAGFLCGHLFFKIREIPLKKE
jgi:hypothetical protein